MNNVLKLIALALMVTIMVLAGTTEEGIKFLATNAKKAGVITLPSGLQYKPTKSGLHDGLKKTKIDPECKVHYTGRNIIGEVFDSSVNRGQPMVIRPSQVIKGWIEALMLMVPGDVWEVAIPSELAYGDQAVSDKIPPGSVLNFVIKMISVDGDDAEL